ncbi:proteasome-interacting protein cic1 [Microbotryomycetes sp. JL221]|nr:proteasome-interacting protein cic1 [Microbotryomycetes sp. JL221]
MSSSMEKTIQRGPPKLFKPASLTPKTVATAPTLSSLPINVKQCENAIKALLAHHDKRQQQQQDNDLLQSSDDKVFLCVGLKKPPKREVHKPVRVPLAHPVMDPRQSPVTLFVKDPQREYKDLLNNNNIKFIERVVGVTKLKTKHKTFEAKRQLLKEAELFLVDDRVMVDVGQCIGKMWRDAKKQPIPIAIVRKDLKAELERAIGSTYLQISTGTNLTIKIGSTGLHTQQQLVDNLLSAIPQLAIKIPDSTFDNIQSLHIKTSTSTSLPIYNQTLDDKGIFKQPSQDQIDKVQQIKQDKEKQREIGRKERSATKSGKGRAEKKRKADEDDQDVTNDEQDKVEESVVETVEEPVKKKTKSTTKTNGSKKTKSKA